jgi:hypothetical protein
MWERMFLCSIRFMRKISEKMDSGRRRRRAGCLSKWSVEARGFLESSGYFLHVLINSCIRVMRWSYCRDASCLCSLAVAIWAGQPDEEISVPDIRSEYSFRFAAKYNIELLTFHNHFVIPTASTDTVVLTLRIVRRQWRRYSFQIQKPQNNGGSIPTKTKLNDETSRFLRSTNRSIPFFCAPDGLI